MRRVVAIAAAAVLFLAGCGSSDDNSNDPTPSPTEATTGATDGPPADIDNEAMLEKVTVEYDDDGVPTITLDGEVVVNAGVARLVSDGDGAPLSDFNRLSLDTLVVDGITGDEIGSSYTDEMGPLRIENNSIVLPTELLEAFDGAHIGARVLWVLYNENTGGTEIYAFNIGEGWNAVEHATGDAVAPVEGLPTVELDDDNVPAVTVPSTDAPDELIVQSLIVGDGPALEAGMQVSMHYVLYTWDDGELRQSSWETGAFTTYIGAGGLIKAWDEGLLGYTVGSQVLIVAPPADAYGTEGSQHELKDDTLVFVVDILDIVG